MSKIDKIVKELIERQKFFGPRAVMYPPKIKCAECNKVIGVSGTGIRYRKMICPECYKIYKLKE